MEFQGKSEGEIFEAAQQAVNNGTSPTFVVKYLTERGAALDVAQRAVDAATQRRVVQHHEEVSRERELIAEVRKTLIWRAVIFIALAVVIALIGIALEMPATSAGSGLFIILAFRPLFQALTLSE